MQRGRPRRALPFWRYVGYCQRLFGRQTEHYWMQRYMLRADDYPEGGEEKAPDTPEIAAAIVRIPRRQCRTGGARIGVQRYKKAALAAQHPQGGSFPPALLFVRRKHYPVPTIQYAIHRNGVAGTCNLHLFILSEGAFELAKSELYY